MTIIQVSVFSIQSVEITTVNCEVMILSCKCCFMWVCKQTKTRLVLLAFLSIKLAPSVLTMFSSFQARTTMGRANTGPAGIWSASLSAGRSRGSAKGNPPSSCEGGRVLSLTRSSRVPGNTRLTTAGSSVGNKHRRCSASDDELQPVYASLSQSRSGDNSPSVVGSTTLTSRPKSTTLSPSHMQQLKRIARKIAEDSSVPLEKLNKFIEVCFSLTHVNRSNYLSRSSATCF